MTAARSIANLISGTGTSITSIGTENTPLIIQAFSGQTADLLQVKNSSGSVVSKIDAIGDFVHPGSILQVQTVKLTSTGVMSSNTGFTTVTDGTTAMQVSFNPKKSNSLIKLEWFLSMTPSNGDPVAWVAPYKDSNSMYTGESTGLVAGHHIGEGWRKGYGTGDANEMMNSNGHWIETNSSINNRVYSLRIKNRGGNYFINRSENNNASQNYSTQGRSIFTVTEIAQ
jgi:hypothetical protein